MSLERTWLRPDEPLHISEKLVDVGERGPDGPLLSDVQRHGRCTFGCGAPPNIGIMVSKRDS